MPNNPFYLVDPANKPASFPDCRKPWSESMEISGTSKISFITGFWTTWTNPIPQLVEALDCMNRKFACPYIIFYPVVSRDGMPFPINRAIRDIQGRRFNEDNAWRGNVLVAKYHDNPFSSLMDASMADFPILKNYLLSHGCPQVSTSIKLNLLHAHLHVCLLVTSPWCLCPRFLIFFGQRILYHI